MNMRNWLWITILLGTFSSTFIFSAPYVQAVTYPDITGNNQHEWIANVTFGDIYNTTGQENNGYGDYTYATAALMTDIAPGATYPLRVIIQPDTSHCKDYISAFFDWNGNGLFTDSGEEIIVAANTCIAGPHTVNVTVPPGAVAGETRMRFVVQYDGAPTSSGAIAWGEAEDYSIWILGQEAYKPLQGNNVFEWITNVTFEDINNTTGRGTEGYSDYAHGAARLMADVIRDETYSLSVTINPAGDEYITAYFDWNHDGEFDDAGESLTVLNGDNQEGPHTVNVNVPADAVPGETRMRVVMKWGSSPPSSGDIVWGEAEDYSILVYQQIWGNPVDNWISEVTFGDISNTTGQETNGFGDYTTQSTNVKSREKYPLSVTISSQEISTTKFVSAFIDWNRNGLFTDPGEEIVVCQVNETDTCTVEISVPTNAVPGETRMRVVQKSDGSPLSFGDINLGEAEDYTVNIMGQLPWPIFIPAISNNSLR